MTVSGKRRLGAAAVCGAGAVLLFHPLWLAAFCAGAWVGYRGKSWLRRIWSDREAML
ncbi:hypothetical protein [uncultured Flavonifractor sp.]|uniref:hypothetical protein n=1 Tax=uncultured Flavonifractor sp. TaxID=1193534 RepID=UPI002619923B|nr:hypothetical protein [uncultured Flavonifractor sp.]